MTAVTPQKTNSEIKKWNRKVASICLIYHSDFLKPKGVLLEINKV